LVIIFIDIYIHNYDSLTELHISKTTVTTAHINSSVFISRCSVAASNGGRFHSSGFPNLPPCLSYQLLTSHNINSRLTTVDVPLLPGSRPRRLAAISQQLPTLITAVSGMSRNSSWSLLYSPGTDHTEHVSSIIACSFVADKTCLQSCSLATAVVLSPVYTAVA
jgi:hypothetical protein